MPVQFTPQEMESLVKLMGPVIAKEKAESKSVWSTIWDWTKPLVLGGASALGVVLLFYYFRLPELVDDTEKRLKAANESALKAGARSKVVDERLGDHEKQLKKQFTKLMDNEAKARKAIDDATAGAKRILDKAAKDATGFTTNELDAIKALGDWAKQSKENKDAFDKALTLFLELRRPQLLASFSFLGHRDGPLNPLPNNPKGTTITRHGTNQFNIVSTTAAAGTYLATVVVPDAYSRFAGNNVCSESAVISLDGKGVTPVKIHFHGTLSGSASEESLPASNRPFNVTVLIIPLKGP